MKNERIFQSIDESSKTIKSCVSLSDNIKEAAETIVKCYKNGGKVLLFGNGGSASQAQHIAAEFINRFRMERRALAAVALTADTSNITSISNDAGFEHVFERQIEALSDNKDVIIAITTSDVHDSHSKNIENGIKAAKIKGAVTIGLLSEKSRVIGDIVDIPIKVPCNRTDRIQESHLMIMHIICELVEEELFGLQA